MSKPRPDIMIPGEKEDTPESRIVLPEHTVEILGGSIEKHLRALLAKHVDTARALTATTKAQDALSETMDRIMLTMQDPNKSFEEAVREVTRLLDLQQQLKGEHDELERAYHAQEAEYQRITDELGNLAKERPEVFVMGAAAEA